MISSKFLCVNHIHKFTIYAMWEIDDRPIQSSQSHPLNISFHVWVFNCEAHCELPADNRKSEIVEESLNWSTQDCNNALRMAIMHALCLWWWSRKRKLQTHRHGMKYAALTAHVLSTTSACEMFRRTRLSRLLRECFCNSLLRIAPCVRLCAQI